MSRGGEHPEDGGIKHPRETTVLYGHEAAESTVLAAYRSGRLAHSFLLAGPPGIGKATLAYRIARFILSFPDAAASAVQSATSLFVAPDHPVARRMAVQAQADVLVLERTVNERTGKLRQDIPVEDVRKTVTFFGSTSARGGWRVALVDAVDELNDQGANALLKILEEPPRKALLLLVSHSAARVLPTIRSRCRRLPLRGLSPADVKRAAAAAIGRDEKDAELISAAALAEGSVRRALMLLAGDTLELRKQTVALLEQLPAMDRQALHALGDRLYGTEPATLEAFVDVVNGWMADRLRNSRQQPTTLDRLARVWTQFNQLSRDTETFNLDRKPLVFNVFTALADASRAC
jgi:DNA polymerase III subunit delta'